MNEPDTKEISTEIPSPRRRPSLPVIWIAVTAALCALFVLASAPGVLALDNLDRNQAADSQRYIQTIQRVFDFVQRHYVDEVNAQTLYEGAMKGMFESLGDPHSSFLSKQEMDDLSETTQGSFGGVGLYISKPIESPAGTKPFVEVASPIEDTPGSRAGINPGDLIISVDGESTDVLSLDEVVARLRGAPGSQVKIIIRRGGNLEFPVSLTRAVIEVPTIKYDTIGDTGYLRLITFTPMTVDRAREALEELKKKNIKNLIIDLRNNYGGLLQSAIGICDLFLDDGLVVSTKSRIPQENMVFNARRGTIIPVAMPVVVLINRGSASASEIVAGALKDRGRAYLIGEKSYGKGSVQHVYPIDKNAEFKLTTSRYYTPSDVNIDKIGIPPDREVLFPELTDAESAALSQLLKDNAIADYVKAHPNMSRTQTEAYSKSLYAKYPVNLPLLQRMIRNEQNRTSITPAYDLDYDVQLQEAVRILRDGDYLRLIKTTKTLRQLQEEAEEEDEALAS